MKKGSIMISVACIGAAIVLASIGTHAYFTKTGTESANAESSVSSQLDAAELYASVQEKFGDTIEQFNAEYGAQFAVASPSDLELAGSDAQQIYQDMLNMTPEEYWDMLEQACDANEQYSLEDDEYE